MEFTKFYVRIARGGHRDNPSLGEARRDLLQAVRPMYPTFM